MLFVKLFDKKQVKPCFHLARDNGLKIERFLLQVQGITEQMLKTVFEKSLKSGGIKKMPNVHLHQEMARKNLQQS